MARMHKMVAIVGLLLGLVSYAVSTPTNQKQLDYVPGEVVVKAAYPESFAVQIFSESNDEVLDVERFAGNHFKLQLADESKTLAMVEKLNKNPMVEIAEPNFVYHTMALPNDPNFGDLWGLNNTGTRGGKADADIDAPEAWDLNTGSKNIVVAVIDTGVDYNHPDLADNIYVNPGEIADNGIDDDGNGFIDDVRGWNFAKVSNNDPMDDNKHGTHVAGTIGAKGDNGQGVAGVNWNVSIMPLKFLTGSGSGTLADAIKAIDYATMMGVDVMNNSWGGGGFSQQLKDAIVRAEQKGVLFVAAAGNSSANSDTRPMYPASYKVDNIISVASSTSNEQLSTFSNYGKRSVHIAAPGSGIYSTVPGGSYATLSGTSMASPHVAGAAALLMAHVPGLTYAQVKERLIRSSDQIQQYSQTIKHSGRLNIYNALAGVYPEPIDIPESAWNTQALREVIETEHPYQDNSSMEFELTAPANAKNIRVVFDKFDTEARYDKVEIIDRQGNVAETLSGDLGENHTSWHVSGNYVKLRFTSDRSVSKYGFKISSIQYTN